MKVELHLHTSRHSACAIAGPEEIVCRLIARGYEAAYLTEHDEVWDEWELAALQAAFPEIRLFPGMEISLGRDKFQHLLVLGAGDRAYLGMPHAGEIIERARDRGHLTVLAHPFRWPESPPEMLLGPLYPDAIELNTCNHPPSCAERVRGVAERLGLAPVNAGDVHAPDFVNRYWIETFEPLRQAGDIFPAVRSRAYRNCPS